ncbi:MAG: hypothetical protein AAGF11_22230 [Myxococcota bacterium]
MAAGRPDHAAHFYAAALDLQPGDTRTRMILADCLVRSNQPTNAADHYLQVALDYAARRRDRETMAICYQVLHLDPRRFAYMTVAPMLRRIGRAAYPLCTRAADAHLAAGRINDGIEMLRLSTELDARNPDAHYRLVQLLLSQHMTRDAVVHLANVGRLLLHAGNNARYVEIAEQLLRLDHGHLETLRELPRVYLRIGEPQRAVVKLSDLMRVSPGDTAGFEILAQAFTVIGRTSTALSILQRLVDELTSTDRRDHAEAILNRARRWRLDDPGFERAVEQLRRVRPPTPPRPQAVCPPTTDEGTVVLRITDLMPAEARPTPQPDERGAEGIVDLSEFVEITDAENTLVLRLRDFTQVGLPPPPPSSSTAHPAVTPSADPEITQVFESSEIELELSEIELEPDPDLDRAPQTAVCASSHSDFTALVHDWDEDGDEDDGDEDGSDPVERWAAPAAPRRHQPQCPPRVFAPMSPVVRAHSAQL